MSQMPDDTSRLLGQGLSEQKLAHYEYSQAEEGVIRIWGDLCFAERPNGALDSGRMSGDLV